MSGSLGDWMKQQRDKLLLNPKFQHWAAAFPLTRPITRSRVRHLFDICAGFVYSQVLQTCVSLDLFNLVKDQPQTAAELAPRLELSEDQTLRLLKAAVALDLMERRSGERFGLGQAGAALLGNPGISAMVRHHAMLYRDLADPVDMLRRDGGGGELQAYWAYARSDSPDTTDSEDIAAYTELMASSQLFIADLVLDAYDVSAHRTHTDMGGGAGIFAMSAARRAPDLSVTVFDLPAVVEEAGQRIEAAGLSDRVSTCGGSFFDGAPLPDQPDLISLVRILHDHDDTPAQEILKKAADSLASGGTLLIAEPLAQTPGAEPAGDAYFGFYLLAMGSGRPRTAQELTAMISTAGLTNPKTISTHTPLLATVLTAQKP